VSPSILAEADDGTSPPGCPQAQDFVPIRRRRRWMVLVLLAALPVALAASWIHGPLSVFITVGWMGAFLLASSLHALTLCPRCDNRCFIRGAWLNPWATRCLHCRMRLYWSDAELDFSGSTRPDPPTRPG
jgi:hypothetical protein